jgi:AbrB family looped-hinge helix DNA binding protein
MESQYVVKITDKGQITLPKELREAYNFKEGDYLLLFPQGEGLRAEKALVSPVSRFKALAADTEKRFRDEGMQPSEVEEAVRWARLQK